GICLGMQLAVVEFARHVCGIKNASSSEFTPQGKENVIDLMESQKNIEDKGGTMRLGAYTCEIQKQVNGRETRAHAAYQKTTVSERHRHRYEVSNRYRPRLEEKGLVVSGRHFLDPKKEEFLVEIIELTDHPWFLGCQF